MIVSKWRTYLVQQQNNSVHQFLPVDLVIGALGGHRPLGVGIPYPIVLQVLIGAVTLNLRNPINSCILRL